MSNPSVSDIGAAVPRGGFGALLRQVPYLIVFVGFVAATTYFVLSKTEPVYKATSTVLVVPGDSAADPGAVDGEAVAGQVQFVASRDIARSVVQRLGLASYSEFGGGQAEEFWLDRLLALVALARPVVETTPEERVLNAYFARLSVAAVDGSRVIAIDFSSRSPQLAAAAANAIAEEYVALQRAAGNGNAGAAEGLEAEVVRQRAGVAEAEANLARYRAEHGSGGVAVSPERVSDLEAELTRATVARAEAEARAARVKALADSGNGPALANVLGASPLMQRLVERQAALKAEAARLRATLLPDHPQMRELATELADVDRQIAGEGGRMLVALEADVRRAVSREAAVRRDLASARAAASNADAIASGLAALEREAAARRSLLATAIARQQTMAAEGGYLSTDVRILSRATVPAEPDFPKVLPMTIAATLVAFILSASVIVLRSVGGATASDAFAERQHAPVSERASADGSRRWTDDRRVRRMMPKEPTLVPEMVDRVQESLSIIAGDIIQSGRKRVLVTLAEGSDSDGRPLGAVALARALARTDARVVLVDLRRDGANAQSMGEGGNLPGFSDLFDGDASFAQVIFRDRKSRVHFIPAGRKPASPDRIDREQMETVLSALTLTYDYVLLDAADEMIPVVGPSCGAVMVVSEFGADDRRTLRAFARVRPAIDARPLLLVVDPASDSNDDRVRSVAGAAA